MKHNFFTRLALHTAEEIEDTVSYEIVRREASEWRTAFLQSHKRCRIPNYNLP